MPPPDTLTPRIFHSVLLVGLAFQVYEFERRLSWRGELKYWTQLYASPQTAGDPVEVAALWLSLSYAASAACLMWSDGLLGKVVGLAGLAASPLSAFLVMPYMAFLRPEESYSKHRSNGAERTALVAVILMALSASALLYGYYFGSLFKAAPTFNKSAVAHFGAFNLATMAMASFVWIVQDAIKGPVRASPAVAVLAVVPGFGLASYLLLTARDVPGNERPKRP